jgi:hypothetical protein
MVARLPDDSGHPEVKRKDGKDDEKENATSAARDFPVDRNDYGRRARGMLQEKEL